MEKLKHVLFHSWYTLEKFEDRIYHIALDVAVFASVISVAAGFVQRLPLSSMLSTGAALLYLIVLQFITMRRPKYADLCRNLLVLGFNLVIFPLCFFSSSGIYCGMILFYLIGLSMCALLLRGKFGAIVFVISLLAMELSITLSFHFPQYVQKMTVEQHYMDVKITLFLAGIVLYSIFVLILIAYDHERRQNGELMQKLRDLSVIDALSGLYNRRELFRRLEVMYGGAPRVRAKKLTRENRYIAMFDVDNSKKLNDTYGHSFGDKALVSVAQILHDMVRPEAGELTARYGGEEFVSVLSAESQEEAYERVDEARRQITKLHWEEFPAVRVSISGGLISCADHPDLTQAMHDVDELLYRAKAAGKNRICCTASTA